MLELRDYLKENQPDVFCITETKLKEEIQVNFEDEGYKCWRRDRRGKGGGGVIVMVRDDMNVEDVQYGDDRAEVIGITIKTSKREKRKIITTYVPPKTNAWRIEEHREMQKEVLSCMNKMLERDQKVLIVGDFNCKSVNWAEMEETGNENSWSEGIIQMAMVNTLDQWVDECTRYRGEEEPAILDLVFTRRPEPRPIIKYLGQMGKSDHIVLQIEVQEEEVSRYKEDYKSGRLHYAKAKFDELRNFYGKIDWKKIMEGKTVQKKYEIFLEKYNDGVKKYVPLYNVRRKKYSWYNARCQEAKRAKDRAWKKLIKQRNLFNSERYKEARNEYIRIRREEERNFEKDVVEKCKEEPKLFYKYVNGKLTNKETIDKVKKEGRIYQTAEEISEIMNESFKTVFTIEEDFEEPSMEVPQGGMHKLEVHKQEIGKKMEKLDVRKAMGPDGVAGWILKECKNQMIEPIWDIINTSLKEGRVPKEWKRANIVPIFKGGIKTEPLNYRPVSLTSVVGKLCETVIKEKWVKYLEENEIITNKQFGFRQGKSCVTNLLSFYSRVIDGVDKRDGWVDAVYLDIKKAFDKVPHNRLLWKLKHIGGLRGKLLEWMEDYLKAREMRTVIRDTYSNWKRVTSGVPQGSVIAPIMFQIYVNDMQMGVTSYINLFADDAKLFRVIESQNDCQQLQSDINRIYEWSLRWKLEFNAKKCHVMEIGKSKRRPIWEYKLGEEVIKKSKEEKDLGVIIQDTLSPERHINNIFNNTYRLLTNIRVAFNYMDKSMMKKIITSIVRPKMEYAAVVWSPNMKKDIRKIERIQRTATKMVPELKDLTYEERLTEMGLQTLQDRRERGDLITLYKIISGIEKIDNEELVVVKEEVSRTRGHSMKIRKNQCVRDTKKYSFPHRIVDTWNGLNEEVVTANSVHNFKEKLDKWRYGDRTL